MEHIPISVLLVESIENVISFFSKLFDHNNLQLKTFSHPFAYTLLKLSNSLDYSIMIVECDAALDEVYLSQLSAISVRRLFISVLDVSRVYDKANQNNLTILDSRGHSHDKCVLMGPDGIIFHFVSSILASRAVPLEGCDLGDIIISSFRYGSYSACKDVSIKATIYGDRGDKTDDIPFRPLPATPPAVIDLQGRRYNSSSSIISPTYSQPPRNIPRDQLVLQPPPRPIIHTLDVQLMTTLTPAGTTAAGSSPSSVFIPCPPNSRKPIPFETEVRV
jgi:hypothetical protein